LNRPFWRRPLVLLPVAGVAAVLLFLLPRLRGPELPGYAIEARPLVQLVVATGRVITTSRVQVGSEISGIVTERRVQEGDRVQPGDVLVVLRADEVLANVRAAEAALRQLQSATRPQAEAALRQAEAQFAQATRERVRREALIERQLIAREALEQAQEAETLARAALDSAQLGLGAVAPGSSGERQLTEQLAAARAQLAKTTVRAGSAGIVLTRNVEPGDLVQPGRVLFTIASDGATEIEVPVDEKNLFALAVGQTAQCIADAWPDNPFPATVTYIAPGVDADRGTVTIRLSVDPVPEFLRQDMTVTVNVETGRRESALAVPNDALLDDRAASAVWAVREGRVLRVPVQLGLRGLAMSEVLEGLSAGDLVLASAATLEDVEEGARVRVVIEDLPSADGNAATRGELPVSFD
jgi:HlyD family secretion protein